MAPTQPRRKCQRLLCPGPGPALLGSHAPDHRRRHTI